MSEKATSKLPSYGANRDPNERTDADEESPRKRKISSAWIGAFGLALLAAAIGALPSAIALLGKDSDHIGHFNNMISRAISWGVIGLIAGVFLGLLVDFMIERRKPRE